MLFNIVAYGFSAISISIAIYIAIRAYLFYRDH